MSLKKLGLTLLAVLVLGGIAANSAMAAATETNGFWYKAGVKLAGSERPSITCSQLVAMTLTSTVGVLNTPVKLEATEATCPDGMIFNENMKAKGRMHIRFKGITVSEPVEPPPTKCSIAGNEFETEPLKAQVWMEGGKAMVRFSAASGETWAEPEIVGCAIANPYPLKGTLFAEYWNATNAESAEQKLVFSSSINSVAGGSLTFGGHPAAITGQLKVVLSGGGQWKVNET
jgi:hypothetical protein